MTIFELTEYKAQRYPKEAIPEPVGEDIWNRYKEKLAIEFPSLKTGHQWEVTPQGWVGFIVVSKEFGISIRPKVEVGNLFRMLEYAYKLKSIVFMKGVYECESIQELFERFARILSKRILDRGRKGFYRNYVGRADVLPYLAGRMNIYDKIRKPWVLTFACDYEEHTADLEENQILAWTLYRIARTNICSPETASFVLKAFRELQRIVALTQFHAKDCVDRLYNRLNEDYQPLHAICRFFLENTGPTREHGDKATFPFLVNMDRLFELFVAEWLRKHLPEDLVIKSQEKVQIAHDGSLNFKIDLVLYNMQSKMPLCVLDTKYKAVESPSLDDVAKTAAYASSKSCQKAFLVYPAAIQKGATSQIGDVTVQCLHFDLDNNIELNGQSFLSKLLGLIQPSKTVV